MRSNKIMKHLISKIRSLFKHKERREPIWTLDKEFFKNSHIYMKEFDCSHIHAKNLIIK